MAKRINWEAYKYDLYASISNEKLWELGSLNEAEQDVHYNNIEQMRDEIEMIENEKTEELIELYGEDKFSDYFED